LSKIVFLIVKQVNGIPTLPSRLLKYIIGSTTTIQIIFRYKQTIKIQPRFTAVYKPHAITKMKNNINTELQIIFKSKG
jgi:hypothetical protein